MNQTTFSLVRDYLRAAAFLYGRIRLFDLYDIFIYHNGPIICPDCFYQLARTAETPYECFAIIGDDDIYRADISVPDMDRWLVHRQYCYATWDSLFTLEYNQEGKLMRLFPKEQMLSYADPTYIPPTPQFAELGQMLRKYYRGNLPLSHLLRQALVLAADDCNAATFLTEMQRLGCRFDSVQELLQLVPYYKQVYDSVPKPIHKGNTEQGIRDNYPTSKPLQRYYLWFCAPHNGDCYRHGLHKVSANEKVTGNTEHQRFLNRCMQSHKFPPRLFEECPCGSGLYYADCCGKR